MHSGVLRFLVWVILAALTPRALLVAENLCLRQQLGVLQRGNPQPRLRNADRWICASRWFAGWRDSLLIVKPETVLIKLPSAHRIATLGQPHPNLELRFPRRLTF
jgi:hypothetical protein